MPKTYNVQCHKTCAEIAEEMGVSKQYIQQVEKAALKKLRVILDAKGIELADVTLSDKDPIILNNGAYIPQSGEKLPHTLPPRVHAFEPVVLPPFPLPKEPA